MKHTDERTLLPLHVITLHLMQRTRNYLTYEVFTALRMIMVVMITMIFWVLTSC